MISRKFMRWFRILPLGDGNDYSENVQIVGEHDIAREFLPHLVQHCLLARTQKST